MEQFDYLGFYSKHLKLLPTGQEHQHKALCPFHENTDTPAFSVNTQKGVWKCFGECDASGGVREFENRLGSRGNVSGLQPDYSTSVVTYHRQLTEEHVRYLNARGVRIETINKFKLGSLGDKITYPYLDAAGRCDGFKAISTDPGKLTFFSVSKNAIKLFNISAVPNAKLNYRDTILLAEGEKDALILAQAGYDVVGVSGTQGFKKEYAFLFEQFKRVIVVFDNDAAGRSGAKRIAEFIGPNCFIFQWKRREADDGYDVNDHFLKLGDRFNEIFDQELITNTTSAQSPIILSASDRLPEFQKYLDGLKGGRLLGFDIPCFPMLTKYMRGIRGMIGIGAPPKVGKSTLTIQIATDVAAQGYPVLYYDFENGFSRIILKMLARKSKVHPDHISLGSPDHAKQVEAAQDGLRPAIRTLFIENDRRLTEEIILSQIRHVKKLTGHDRVLLVVDSVQKLPMNLGARREGIDGWIRFFENVRDTENATIIVISELARSGYEQCGISSWKESGDLEYSFDHMIQLTRKNRDDPQGKELTLNMIASRELEPGEIATYRSIRPLWYFDEIEKGFF
ncbi:DnaB-like helicase C-terminal domain-containing protein [Bdellovibrionota bacterium FG-1]